MEIVQEEVPVIIENDVGTLGTAAIPTGLDQVLGNCTVENDGRE
jgi:hypothetical protein